MSVLSLRLDLCCLSPVTFRIAQSNASAASTGVWGGQRMDESLRSSVEAKTNHSRENVALYSSFHT